jgi:hemerythrin-like metal-binding protein
MDDQHGNLMDALNELRLVLSHCADPMVTKGLLEQLMALARLHFESEEQLLERYEFPGLASHRSEHSNMLARLAQYAGVLTNRQSSAGCEIADSLRGWFKAHTEGCDRLYGPWLRERGVR